MMWNLCILAVLLSINRFFYKYYMVLFFNYTSAKYSAIKAETRVRIFNVAFILIFEGAYSEISV